MVESKLLYFLRGGQVKTGKIEIQQQQHLMQKYVTHWLLYINIEKYVDRKFSVSFIFHLNVEILCMIKNINGDINRNGYW